MEVLPEEHGMERVIDGIECVREDVVDDDEVGNDGKERTYFSKERR